MGLADLTESLEALSGALAVVVSAFGLIVTISQLAYVAFFPLVVVVWKLPRILVKRRSTVLLSSLAGIVTGFLSRAKFFIVALAVACLSGSMITMSDSPPSSSSGCAQCSLPCLGLVARRNRD
jgi:hypothetical protein